MWQCIMVSDTGKAEQVRYVAKWSSWTIYSIFTVRSPNCIVWEAHGHHEHKKDSKNVLCAGVKRGLDKSQINVNFAQRNNKTDYPSTILTSSAADAMLKR